MQDRDSIAVSCDIMATLDLCLKSLNSYDLQSYLKNLQSCQSQIWEDS